jgi:hypothetical protein
MPRGGYRPGSGWPEGSAKGIMLIDATTEAPAAGNVVSKTRSAHVGALFAPFPYFGGKRTVAAGRPAAA